MLDSGEFRVKLNPDRTSFVKATPPDPDCTSSPLSGSFKWHFDIDEAKINVFFWPKIEFSSALEGENCSAFSFWSPRRMGFLNQTILLEKHRRHVPQVQTSH